MPPQVPHPADLSASSTTSYRSFAVETPEHHPLVRIRVRVSLLRERPGFSRSRGAFDARAAELGHSRRCDMRDAGWRDGPQGPYICTVTLLKWPRKQSAWKRA